MREVKSVRNRAAEAQQIQAKFFDTWIPERAATKRELSRAVWF